MRSAVRLLLCSSLILSAPLFAAQPGTPPAPPPATAPAPSAPGQAVTTPATGKACVADCSTAQDFCATQETMEAGADRKNLCATRFKVCIERCDPHYLNYHKTIDDNPVKDDGPAAPKMTAAERCVDGCGAQARTCSDAGNGAKVCDAGRAACMSRCGTLH